MSSILVNMLYNEIWAFIHQFPSGPKNRINFHFQLTIEHKWVFDETPLNIKLLLNIYGFLIIKQ